MSTSVLQEMPMVKPPQRRWPLRTIGFFSAAFVVGSVTGAGLAALYLQPAPPTQPAPPSGPIPSRGFSEGFVKHMSEEYELTDEQTESLKGIIRENNERIDLINKEFRPKFGQSIERMNSEISGMMNPEQQVKFKKKLEEMRARWANRKSDGHRPSFSHSHSGSRSVPKPTEPSKPAGEPEASPTTQSEKAE